MSRQYSTNENLFNEYPRVSRHRAAQFCRVRHARNTRRWGTGSMMPIGNRGGAIRYLHCSERPRPQPSELQPRECVFALLDSFRAIIAPSRGGKRVAQFGHLVPELHHLVGVALAVARSRCGAMTPQYSARNAGMVRCKYWRGSSSSAAPASSVSRKRSPRLRPSLACARNAAAAASSPCHAAASAR
jgi:hypothetical protein